jgi:hypothetical protein
VEARSVIKHLFKQVALILIAAASLHAFPADAQKQDAAQRQKIAMAMFEERCKRAGEFIHRTADNVEGILLMKVRPQGVNYGDQYELDDPYGRDLAGKGGYIESFLKGSYEAGTGKPVPIAESAKGYWYVEAVDSESGVRYRYTGRLEEPWQTDKKFLKGYVRFVVDKAVASGPPPRYGVTYDDISTHEERDYWIAGSSLRVIDMRTNEVLAERVGYMVDVAQGSRSGSRSPWLLAADHACPSFGGKYGSLNQGGQTERFVEKVLRPKH